MLAIRIMLGGAKACVRRTARQPAGVVTIGYEQRSLEAYLNELLRAGVTLVFDVRRNPLSRKYGFSKGTLSNACEGLGIAYAHVPELGIASEDRRGLTTQADYDGLFASYEQEFGVDFLIQKSINHVIDSKLQVGKCNSS